MPQWAHNGERWWCSWGRNWCQRGHWQHGVLGVCDGEICLWVVVGVGEGRMGLAAVAVIGWALIAA